MKLTGKILMVFCLLSAMVSCRSSKTVTSSLDTHLLAKDNSISDVDTTKKVTTNIEQEQKIFGDTLTGNLAFTDEQIDAMENHDHIVTASENIQTLESNGVKIQVSLQSFKGGVKAKLKAIAKPIQITNTIATTQTENKAVSNTHTNVSVEQTQAVKTTKKIVGFPWLTLIFSLLIFLLLALLFIYKKYFQKWQL